jgi:hypothetical protein
MWLITLHGDVETGFGSSSIGLWLVALRGDVEAAFDGSSAIGRQLDGGPSALRCRISA